MSEKKPTTFEKSSSKEKDKPIEELKSQFLAKQSSSEWSSILMKEFFDDKIQKKLCYEDVNKLIESLKEINKIFYKTALSFEFLEKLLEKVKDFSIISLFLKDFYIHTSSKSYEFSYSYNSYNSQFGNTSKKYDLQKIMKLFDEKIKKLENEKMLDKLLYTDFFSEFLISKKTNEITSASTEILTKEYLQNIRLNINIFTVNILENLADLITSKEILSEILVKWILMMEPTCNMEELQCLKIISNFLLPQKSYYSLPKINHELVWKMLKIIIDICKYPYSEDDLLIPYSNAFVFFEIYSRDQWKEIANNIATDLLETFKPQELARFFSNVINESYTEGILIFFFHLTKVLCTSSRKNKEIYLIAFFHEVVLTSIINKFQSEQYFKFTVALLDEYFFGLHEIVTLDESTWDTLMKAANYVIHFEKKYIQEYYELLKSLHKLYLKEKKILYNDREILNFLDGLRMNNSNLIEPSEKRIEECKSQSWKFKLTETLKAQIPKGYLNFEKPNNLVKYKGLKNMGNTCYINSFVQSLYMTMEFRDQILKVSPKKLPTEENVFAELKQLFLNFQEETAETFFDPIILKTNLPEPFKTSNDQQDALEFGRLFFDIIEKILIDSKNENFVERLFFGECVNNFECMNCKKSTKMTEKILDLSVNFNEKCYLPREGSYDLKEMLSYFVEKEEFKDNNRYFCENCNNLSNLMIKTPLIKKLPPFLLVTANRFYFDAKLGIRRKLCHKIKECYKFNIKEVFGESIQKINPAEEYMLYAMIIHAGSSLESGHYFSIAKDFVEDYWYVFNDTVVQCLGKNPNFNRYLWDYETPYIYFFVHRTMIPLKKK